MQLKDLPIGSLVKDPNSLFLGQPIIWKIADKNYTGYPDNSITLISDKVIAERVYDAKEIIDPMVYSWGDGRYSVSNIRQWLNSDAEPGEWYTPQHKDDFPPNEETCNQRPYINDAGFLNAFSNNFKKALLNTTLYLEERDWDEENSETITTSVTIEDKIFLANHIEVGLNIENMPAPMSLTDESSAIPFQIFTDDTSRIAYYTNEAAEDDNNDWGVEGGAAHDWALRTQHPTTDSMVIDVLSNGTVSGIEAFGENGIRPLCNLDASTAISDEPDTDGCYILTFIPNAKGYLDGKGVGILLNGMKEYVDNVFAQVLTKENIDLINQQLEENGGM